MAVGGRDLARCWQEVPLASPQRNSQVRVLVSALRIGLGFLWILFQIYIIFHPQAPLVQRALHLTLAIVLLFLWTPLDSRRLARFSNVIDAALITAAFAAGLYCLLSAERLAERMEGVDPVLPADIFWGILVVLLLLEGVRGIVGWSLLGVLLSFLVYAFAGIWIPGRLRFSGFRLEEVAKSWQCRSTAFSELRPLRPYNSFSISSCSARFIQLSGAGIIEQHPNLKLLCPHVGGALPCLIGRIDHQVQILERGGANLTKTPSEYLRSVYFDTVSPLALAIRCAYDFIGPDRLMFASDHPWVEPDVILREIRTLDLPPDGKTKIFSGNAKEFFGL